MANPNQTSKDSVAFLSGASRMLPFDYSAGDATMTEAPRSIHVNVDGSAVVRLQDDTEDRTLVLVGGQTYQYQVVAVRNAGTTAGMGIFACY